VDTLQTGCGAAGYGWGGSVVDSAYCQAAALRHAHGLLRAGLRNHLLSFHRLLHHRGSDRGPCDLSFMSAEIV